MKKLSLALFTLAVAALAGCGASGCTSSEIAAANPGGSCALKPGSDVQVTVAVNCKCTDTSASCQAEWVGDRFEVAPAVQQCSEQQQCDTQGCEISGRTATCVATIPADVQPGNYDIFINAARSGTVTISGNGTSSCAL